MCTIEEIVVCISEPTEWLEILSLGEIQSAQPRDSLALRSERINLDLKSLNIAIRN